MKKKLGALFVCLLMAASLVTGGVFAASAATPPPPQQGGWQLIKGEDTALWTEADGTVSTTKVNTGFMSNGYATSYDSQIGDYTVSATFKGTKDSADATTGEIGLGFFPWYVDNDNWIIAYMCWKPDTVGRKMTSLQITGKINGADAVVWNGGFNQSAWNDIWMDSSPERLAAAQNGPSATLKFTVKKELSEAGDTDIFRAYINDVEMGFVSFRDTVKFAASKVKVGLYACNDNVTVTDYAVTPAAKANRYAVLAEGVSARSTSDAGWVKTEADYSVDATAADTKLLDNSLIMDNAFKTKSYAVSSSVALSGALPEGEKAVGAYGWYKDAYNYVAGYVVTDGTDTKAKIEGKITTHSSAALSVVNISAEADYADAFGDIASLNLKKQGAKLVLEVNGVEAVAKEGIGQIVEGANVGFFAQNVSASFGDAKVSELNYVAYDWFKKTVQGRDFYVSAAADDSVNFISNSNFELAVDEAETVKPASVRTSSGKYGNITTAVEFTAADGGSFGVYPWYESADKNLFVQLKGAKLTVIDSLAATAKSTEFDLPAGFTFAGEHILTAEINNQKLSVVLDTTAVVSDYALSGNELASAPEVGVAAMGKDVIVSDFTVTGFAPYDKLSDGDWDFYGARTNTWSKTESAVAAIAMGGTEFKNTKALLTYGQKDMFMGAKITVNQKMGGEYKTGIIPYWKDSGNHLYVWLAQWEGAPTTITLTGRMNGAAVGTEWRETNIPYTYDGPNYLEVQIVGDQVKVYLNKALNPQFNVTLDGFSNRDLTGAKVGLNVFNTAATFEEVDAGTERIFAFKEKPVIEVVGTKVTAAKQGDQITLPVITASNSIGEVLTPTVVITAPDGKPADKKGNKFTAEQVGKYTVTITCTDSWGNVADAYSYTIEVAEQAKKGCKSFAGGVQGLSLAALGLALAGACILLIGKRRAKNK